MVKGASRIAAAFGIRPIIIGMTVVAFGTSAPEFLVSLVSALKDSPDIAVGNIIGSNIANIGLILGISALIHRISIQKRLLRTDMPIMIVSVVVLFGMALDQQIGRLEGLLLFAGIIAFVVHLIYVSRKENAETGDVEGLLKVRTSNPVNVAFVILGLGGLSLGSHLMVESAITIARFIGVSEIVIGMTVVAIGTSLPELATSIVAAWKREPDISVGNIVGSNVFNVLFVIGGVAAVKPLAVKESTLYLEFPVMIAFCVLVYPVMWSRRAVTALEGAVLLIAYIGFVVVLFVRV